MKKTVICTKCRVPFTLEGPKGRSKLVVQGVTCPFCKEPNEVDWSMGSVWTKTPPDRE